jgi:hypothetical protein
LLGQVRGRAWHVDGLGSVGAGWLSTLGSGSVLASTSKRCGDAFHGFGGSARVGGIWSTPLVELAVAPTGACHLGWQAMSRPALVYHLYSTKSGRIHQQYIHLEQVDQVLDWICIDKSLKDALQSLTKLHCILRRHFDHFLI